MALADFAESVWGRRPSLSTAADLAAVLGPADPSLTTLLTLADVDDLLSVRGMRTPFLRVARAGRTVPAGAFTRGGGVGAGVADQVDDVALARLFADGHTLVLQGLHRLHPPVIGFAQQLTADLGHPVQANAYVTPLQAQGFSDHYDVHDVFVVQLAGTKRWLIRPPVHRHPPRDRPWTDHRAEVERAAQAEPLLDVVLAPGDVLYLPAGYLHAARALGEVSAHLTLGVHIWTRGHLIEHLVRQLADAEELREPLALGVDVTDPGAVGRELATLLPVLTARLDQVDAAAVASGLAGAVRTAQRAEPVAPVAQSGLLGRLDDQAWLCLRRHLRARLERALDRDGEAWVLRTVDGDQPVPAEAVDAVGRLVHGEAVAVADLGADLARRWVAAAVLVAR